MRDGVELLADHYSPATDRSVGTVLVRGPYGRRFPFTTVFARPYAAHGYHVVIQSVRGTFGSGGDFEPMANEVTDGADTVGWLRRQPWFTGSFATIGLSYLGFTQWALLVDPPPELAAAVITVAPHDFGQSHWGTGAFTLGGFLGWSDMVAHQEDGPMWRVALAQSRTKRRVAHALTQLPLGEAGRALLGSGAPWYESWIEHADLTDAFWQPRRLSAALDRVDVPVLLFGGWQDIFLEQTLQQYRHLHDRGVEVALTVGPWTHAELIKKAAGLVTRESFDWLDAHLGGEPSTRRSPVRVFMTGAGWLDLLDWPPATSERVLYLHSGGGLAAGAPAPAAPPSSFRYDPADPTPTVGGRVMSDDGGYRDDSALARRADVLSFTSDALTNDLDV
ncbi:MAG: CocE/NonD family hydrolase, partial [Mycobacteriaceae bacterium]|nr:CocE/NonD family hydrolase [Mycobacteriaceae bacterium]